MNKLTALSKLANAYWHQGGPAGSSATSMLEEKFGYIRRSMTLEDLKPQPKSTEGLNPAGPKYL
jgi:hypothetical protein